MKYNVRKSEPVLFAVKVILTIVIVFCVLSFLFEAFSDDFAELMTVNIIIVYAVLIFLYVWIYKVFLVAYMKGNGICVSPSQFSPVYELYCEMAKELGIKKIPPLFVLQEGGLLNAFAIRLSGKNYIAIYSDIFSMYKTDMEAVKFVLAHELGHVKRKHNQKRFWTFPSSIVPFLTAAYSRSCEYTCDSVGAAFIPEETDRLNGLLVLAGGKDIYRDIDIKDYLETAAKNRSFAVKFVNMFISHPYLPNRIKALQR